MSVPDPRYRFRFGIIALSLIISSCAAYSVVNSDRYSGHSAIPDAERPPAGQCRLWYDNRRVSEQPPAGDCERLRDTQPDNARLIRG